MDAMVKTSPHVVDKTVGARVRQRRNQQNMSQTDLALKLGLTFQQVQKYEKGTNRISMSRMVEIAVIQKMPITFYTEGLVKQGEIVGKPLEHIEFLKSKDGVRLMQEWVHLTTAQRRSVLRIIEQLAGARK